MGTLRCAPPVAQLRSLQAVEGPMPNTVQFPRPRPLVAALIAALIAAACAISVPAASTSTTQISMFEASELLYNPTGAAQALRLLGVNEIRLVMYWNSLAPDVESSRTTPKFQATNPAAYPASAWAPYDAVISARRGPESASTSTPGAARRYGHKPKTRRSSDREAGTHPRAPSRRSWRPSASDTAGRTRRQEPPPRCPR